MEVYVNISPLGTAGNFRLSWNPKIISSIAKIMKGSVLLSIIAPFVSINPYEISEAIGFAYVIQRHVLERF